MLMGTSLPPMLRASTSARSSKILPHSPDRTVVEKRLLPVSSRAAKRERAIDA